MESLRPTRAIRVRSGRRVGVSITRFRRALHTRGKALSDHDLLIVDLLLTPKK